MKKLIKRYLLTVLLCFGMVIIGPTTITVNAEDDTETTEPSPDADKVLEYILENKDVNYLLDNRSLFPDDMVGALLSRDPDTWTQMLKDEDARIGGELYIVYSSTNKTTSGGLTKSAGVYNGPSGKETYYNLNMSGVVSIMRSMGYSEEEYPYWVREDGCKMLGDYIMVAANFSIRPRGTIVETSLGQGIVCDTGGFASYNTTQLDIATNW